MAFVLNAGTIEEYMNLVYAKFKEKIKRTDTIESFRFELDKKLDFEPGQFLKIVFDEKDINNKEFNKYLSFSSSPLKDYIEVTKRLSDSNFSNALKSLKPGDKLMMQGPLGNCVFKNGYDKIGFLIGGIGITPVISIIEYIIERNMNTDIILVYSSRHNRDIAFRPELDEWKKSKNNLKVIYMVNECKPQDEVCIQGQINKELIDHHVVDLVERRFFICGPPPMVAAMKQMCIESSCNKDLIHAENFIGY